jgi:hypothetical protein
VLMWRPHGRTIPAFAGKTSREQDLAEGNPSIFILCGRA